MSKNMTVVLPEKIDSRLQKAKENTGLNKSEIARRGISSELNELGVDK